MQDLEYAKAIELLKEKFSKELVNHKGRFNIENGELFYVHSGTGYPDMGKLQQFINQTLGQKVYRVEFVGFKEVYARSVEEANEFADMDNKPNPTRVRTEEVKDYNRRS